MRKLFKILFIDAIDRTIRFQTSYPHLGIGYMVSYLRKEIKDLDILVVNSDELKRFRYYKPDLVAISSVTQNYNKAKTIAKTIKENRPKCPVILGGVHISVVPRLLERNIDIGVIGEGEETLVQIVKNIQCNDDFLEHIDCIDGLVFWKDNNLVMTKERAAIDPLDKILHPDRSVLPEKENQLLLTSRGCPYRCAFCASSYYWKKSRYFSADYVLEEIELILRSFPVLNLAIYDDLFVCDKKRLKEISCKIVNRGYNKKISFWCNARANLIDEETVSYLKDMNMKGVSMGLESGSNRVLKAIKHGEVSVEINQKAINLCKEYGLFVHGSFMLGNPYETEEEMSQTSKFIKNCGIDKGDIMIADPLPGTPFWDYAVNEKLVDLDMDWSKLACWSIDRIPEKANIILLSKEISKERFLKIFYDIASFLLNKRKSYEAKWNKIQGKEIRLKSFFSVVNFRKFKNNPIKGIRYLLNFILSVPNRLGKIININKKLNYTKY